MVGDETNGGGGGEGGLVGGSGIKSVLEPPDNEFPWSVFGWWVLILALAVVGGYFAAPEVPNSGFVSAAAVLTFVTTAAVGIERIIEGGFAVLGRSSRFGGWWPLRQVIGAIKAFEQNTNAYVEGPLAVAIKELTDLKTAAVNTGELAAEAQKEVEATIAAYERTHKELQARLTNLKKLPAGSPRFERANELAATATNTINQIAETISNLSGRLGDTVLEGADAIAGATDRAGDIVVSFSDNPARKILSLMVGSILGIVIASFMGLNLFLAVLDGAEPDAPTDTGTGICDGGAAGCFDGRAGIIVTGVIIGLGANPTHEVIKALQRRGRSRDDGEDDASDTAAPGGQGFNVLGIAVPAAVPRAAAPIRRRHVRSTD